MAVLQDLPDDALAAVLRRLPPRSLALSRRVCKAWRDVVDARGLLRPDLLPFKVGGIFIGAEIAGELPFKLFARPSNNKGPNKIPRSLDFVPVDGIVLDHCNGLFLYENGSTDEFYIANPATRQLAQAPVLPLPEARAAGFHFQQSAHLVFDPVVSPHYEVFIVPVPSFFKMPEFEALHSQGAYSSCTLNVFSSATRRWEERFFVMEDGDAVQITNTEESPRLFNLEPYGVFWKGALYAPWHYNFVTRFSLADGKYRIIEMPTDFEPDSNKKMTLGRSKDGVYCALTNKCPFELQIWLLNESDGQMQWVLKQHVDVTIFVLKFLIYHDPQTPGPWTLSDDTDEGAAEESYEWNSDDDSVLDIGGIVPGNEVEEAGFLGFHPRKEIVFFHVFGRGFAYHWSTSKFQDLGDVLPKNHEGGVVEPAFVYTPCWMEELPGRNLEGEVEE